MHARFVGQREAIASIAFSPDGRTLASAAAERGVSLWHVATGLIMGQIGPADPSSVAFTADGRHLMCLNEFRRLVSLNAGER